ncbi:MAG: helix-hairpin-helix domain-containing protein, partial [Eubacteriales bacterium]|nr:helix-hairpin-helix domain-containing protein [Eubacteriales bacterium]
MPDTHVGAVLTLGGHWRIDSKYGRQFEVVTFEETLPATVYGIEKYLGSGLIKGIGPKFAKLIVTQFGKDTLDVIEAEPERLIEVPNIGKKRVEAIKRGWAEQKEIKNIMLFLQDKDVSTAHATRIYKQYGAESIKVEEEYPYKLADDIWGIGFKTADTIATKLGIEKERFIRLRSGLLYTLNKLAEEGHCYGTRAQLLETGAKLLDVDESLLSMTLDEMVHTKDVIVTPIPVPPGSPDSTEVDSGVAIYLPPFFYSEVGVENRLKKIYASPAAKPAAEQLSIAGEIEYDPVQLEAIQTAVRSKIMVLTGGPGTGKSTTTMGIIRAFRGQKVLLAAPTGRAAKRLSEVTGMEAKTIHRLLEFKPPEGYKRKENNPLEGDVLIVDESSMIDVILMYSLLRAVPDGMRLILVGDVDAMIMEQLLTMKGIEVEIAEDGQKAVDMYRDRPEGYYDAVLMDIRMPVMDGLQATEHIRAMGRSDSGTLPVIALTANAFDEDVQRSLLAGMNAHLSKPVEPERLYRILSELIVE